MSGGLRIALLAHSTNPRGGVVHAMELATALQALGHHPTLFAPDPGRKGFFRAGGYEQIGVPASSCMGGLLAMVEQRVDEYVAYFAERDAPDFDIFHAQDPISGNALAELRGRGTISSFLRTVHHLDAFDDPHVQALQTNGFVAADEVLCVSELWRERLHREYRVSAGIVTNGIDIARFSPLPTTDDAELRGRFQLGSGPLFLSVGGIEPRKNSVRILQAFHPVRQHLPAARLLIVGGATLLDHSLYASEFACEAQRLGLGLGAGGPIVVIGQVEDRAMPALYRLADALVFPSIAEGFGLVVLEAMACGTPAVVSDIAPFTEYLPRKCSFWAQPASVESIANAMLRALEPQAPMAIREWAERLAETYSWRNSALQHAAIYRRFLARQQVVPKFNPVKAEGVLHA